MIKRIPLANEIQFKYNTVLANKERIIVKRFKIKDNFRNKTSPDLKSDEVEEIQL